MNSETTKRELSTLPLSHDYMFWAVMKDEYIFCKRFLEELLQVRIGRIEKLQRETQHNTIRDTRLKAGCEVTL